MKSYIVGGAVRDALLGVPVQDRDYVVVGATSAQMLALGFRPVGNDFPVFLHPQTGEEYALARTERKVAPGYKGFAFYAAQEVTLEQDLARRDLTVNAMAQTEEGVLVDPFGGQRDLENKILRHVSPAFTEDPVRILRVARFAARFIDFQVAPETVALMKEIVRTGEVDALVPERVWQELARGLMEVKPSRMLEVLSQSGALARVFPGMDQHIMSRLANLDAAVEKQYELPVRFAVLMAGMTDLSLVNTLCQRLKVPSVCRDLAMMVTREYELMKQVCVDAEVVVGLFERCDVFRRPQRWDLMIYALDCAGSKAIAYWQGAWNAAHQIDIGPIVDLTAQHYPDQPERIALAIHAQRVSAVFAFMKTILDLEGAQSFP